MGVVQQFSKVQHVGLLETKEQLIKVLTELGSFAPADLAGIEGGLADTTVEYSAFSPVQIQIGIKKLYAVAEMALQADDKVDVFLYSLYEECKRNSRV